MQPSTTSTCQSNQWNFWSNNQTLYGNVLGSDSVNVQETSHSASVGVFPALGYSNNLDTNQRMTISPSNGRRKVSLKREWGAFLPLAINIIKCSAAQTSSSEPDALQSDGGNNNGYLPPVHITPQQNPLPSSSTRGVSTSPSTSTRGHKGPRSDRRTHGSAPSRNRQATTDEVEDIRVNLLRCRIRNRDRLKDLDCPVIGCQYTQLNGRMPDFRRHVRTHMRGDGEIRCKGVPWEKFERHRHLFPKIPSGQQPYAVPDEDGLWIGGCLKTFSRADALKRHLRNTCCTGLNQKRHRTSPA